MATPAAPSDIPPDILRQLQDPSVRKLLAEAMVGEAGGEGPQGMQDVMDVVFNRAREGGQSVGDVINTRGAFTSMDEGVQGGRRGALDAMSDADLARAYAVISKPNPQWDLPPTADAFYNPQLQKTMHSRDPNEYLSSTPSWARGSPLATVGHHEFFSTGYKGGKVQTPGEAAPAGGAFGGLDEATIKEFLPSKEMRDTAEGLIKQGIALTPEILKNIREKAEFDVETGNRLASLLERNDAITARYTKATDAIIAGLPDEQKIQQEELRKVSDEPLHPSRVLGQLMPMLAVIGGAFLGAGPSGVLDTAAAAANAARGHDEKAMTQAHLEFQDKLTESIDKASLVHEEMAQGIAANKDDMAGVLEVAGLVGAKYGVAALEQAALQGSAKTVFDWMDMGTKTLSMLSVMQNRALDGQIKAKKLDQLQQQADAGNALNDDEVKLLAERAYETGKDPSLGWGQGLRERYYKIAADVIKEHASSGASDADAGADAAAAGAEFHAGAQALNQIEKTRTQIQQFEGTAQREADLTLSLAAKGTAGGVPLFNKWIQAGRKALAGDPDVTSFDTALVSFKNEYARIMSTGGTGTGAQTSDKSRAEADSLINDAQTLESLQRNIATMKKSMGNRMSALDDAVANAKANLRPGADTGAAPSSSTGLKPEEKAAWVQHVEEGRARLRAGKNTPEEIKAKLKEAYPDASDEQLNQAVANMDFMPGAKK